jgi:hypothetical protein
VLTAIEHVGWYGQLWFPTVDRDDLNLPDGPTDDELRAALFALIDSGVVEVRRVRGDDEVRLENPSAETIEEVKKDSTETDVTLQIKDGVIEELEANERRKWLEVRDTEAGG